MACRFEYNGKTYDQDGLAKELEKMLPSEAHKYIDGVQNVPNAPFKKTWDELALKRVIRHAVKNGYDSVSWTPGEAQALRYPDELRRQVKKIEWLPSETTEGVKQVVIHPTNGSPVPLRVDTKDGIIRGGTYAGKKVDEVFGKDMSSKIMKEDKGILEGKDFVIGTEGMKGFYDKMLVDKANAIGKKFGSKVEQKEINVPRTSKDTREGEFATIEEFDAAKKKQPIHVLKITPEMRKQVMEKGFPLFSGGPIITPIDYDPFKHKLTPVEFDPWAK